MLRSPSSEIDTLGEPGPGAVASFASGGAATRIDGSIGEPSRPPTPIASPPTHPGMAAIGARPALSPPNARALVEAPPSARTRVVLATASSPGIGMDVAASTFVVKSTPATTPTPEATTTLTYAPIASSRTPPGYRTGVAPGNSTPSIGVTGASASAARSSVTVAPEGSPGGPSVTSTMTVAPVLAAPLPHPTRGGGGANLDALVRAAGEALVRAGDASAAIPAGLDGTRQRLAEVETVIAAVERELATPRSGARTAELEHQRTILLGEASPLRAAVDDGQRRRDDYTAALADAVAAKARVTTIDPAHADAWVESAADRVRHEAPDPVPTRSQRIRGTYEGWMAQFDAEAEAADATREGTSQDDRARSASLDRSDARMRELRALRDDSAREFKPEERSELRALEATAAARRVESAKLERRAASRHEAAKRTWKLADAESKRRKQFMGADDYARWQAAQDLAAEGEEAARRGKLAAMRVSGKKMSGAQTQELADLEARQAGREERAKKSPAIAAALCPNCPPPESCRPPSTWVCTPARADQKEKRRGGSPVTTVKAATAKKPNVREGGGAKAPIVTEGSVPGVGGPGDRGVAPVPVEPDGATRAQAPAPSIDALLDRADEVLGVTPAELNAIARETDRLASESLEKALDARGVEAHEKWPLRELAKAETAVELLLERELELIVADFALELWLKHPDLGKPVDGATLLAKSAEVRVKRAEIARAIEAVRRQRAWAEIRLRDATLRVPPGLGSRGVPAGAQGVGRDPSGGAVPPRTAGLRRGRAEQGAARRRVRSAAAESIGDERG